MDSEYEERVVSILRGRGEWDDKYASISEFKQHLDEPSLAHEELGKGCVLHQQQSDSEYPFGFRYHIVSLLKSIASECGFRGHDMVQFWAVDEMEERHHYLSTIGQPFSVGQLNKGLCWYRKLCRGHAYDVDVVERGDEEQQQLIGGVGRAYRNGHPESTPDLRLYSTGEFPLRDEAARCGFTCYLALPLFDFHKNVCCGVLEVLFNDPRKRSHLFSKLDGALQVVTLHE